MKKRHTVTHSLKQFCKMISEGNVVFDYPLQRDKNQWTHAQKSLLIHSIATDYAVPAVYSKGTVETTDAGYTQTIYSILDGKQRLTSVHDYLLGQYALMDETPAVRLGNHHYEMAGCYFSELPQPVQDAIYDYTINMYYFVNVTDDELADMFYRLNNGTPMSNQQKVKSKMGVKTATTLNELVKHPFASECVTMTSQQRKRAGDEQVIVEVMMLLDSELNVKVFGNKHIEAYAESMRAGKTELFARLEKAMDYLVEVSPEAHAMFKKKHASYMLMMADQALSLSIPSADFADWMSQFAAFPPEGYEESVTGKTSAKKVHNAIQAVKGSFEAYFAKEIPTEAKAI